MSKTGKSGRTAGILLIVVIAMFGFGYLLVPLYNVICDITGLNGKTGQISAAEAATRQIDKNRTIKVQFVTNNTAGSPWDFRPNELQMEVHPGGVYQTTFRAVNKTAHSLVGQAIPSLAPQKAALYFNKTECFCFSNQGFKPHEGRDMPVQFIVDPDLPAYIDSLVLSYTFFDITNSRSES